MYFGKTFSKDVIKTENNKKINNFSIEIKYILIYMIINMCKQNYYYSVQ